MEVCEAEDIEALDFADVNVGHMRWMAFVDGRLCSLSQPLLEIYNPVDVGRIVVYRILSVASGTVQLLGMMAEESSRVACSGFFRCGTTRSNHAVFHSAAIISHVDFGLQTDQRRFV
jgi:hypothetical protein